MHRDAEYTILSEEHMLWECVLKMQREPCFVVSSFQGVIIRAVPLFAQSIL